MSKIILMKKIPIRDRKTLIKNFMMYLTNFILEVYMREKNPNLI